MTPSTPNLNLVTQSNTDVGEQLLLKAVPASQEDLHLRAHSRCKRRLMDSASAALVLSSDEAPHQVACIMLVLIDSFTLRPLVTSSTSSMCVAVASK